MRSLLVALLLLCTAPAMAQRIALVIGNGAYRHVERLANPANDARAIAAALRPLGFDVDLVVDADRAGMETAIRRFGSRAERAEAALFFYAGHAIEVAGQNMLAPVSAQVREARDLPFELVSLDLVLGQAEGRARVLLVFLDACRDNPFRAVAGNVRGGAGRGLAAPAQSATGTLVAFATAPGQVALDGRGRNSPFTAALLQHLATPGLEVRSLMGRVRQSVRIETAGRQIPWDSSSLEGEFFFRPGSLAAAPPAPLPAPAPAPAPAPPAPSPGPVASLPPGASRATGNGAAALRIACPQPGVVFEGSYNLRTTWRGADPAAPQVCVGSDNVGRQVRRVLGLWDATDPGATARAASLAGLFPPRADASVTLRRQVGTAPASETWRWVGDVPGRTLQRDIRVLADEVFEARWTYRLDAEGAIAEARLEHIRGVPFIGGRPQPNALTDAMMDQAANR
jgi:hypothetical protein